MPQFPHVYVTCFSSLNTLWASVESLVSLVLIPSFPWAPLKPPSVTSGGLPYTSPCLLGTTIVLPGTTDSAGAAVAPLGTVTVLGAHPARGTTAVWSVLWDDLGGRLPCPVYGSLIEGHQSNSTYGPTFKRFW